MEIPNNKCKWCGFEPHDRRVRPAREATCNYGSNWDIKNQSATKGPKKVHYVQDNTPSQSYLPEFSDSTDFLGYLTKDMGGVSSSTPSQDVTVKLNGIPTSFSIDTGADVTIIDKDTFDAQFQGQLLRKPVSKLRGPDLNEIKTCGYFKAEIIYRPKTVHTVVYVLPKKCTAFAREACEKLGLVNFNMNMQIGHIQQDVLEKYPQLFDGLGKLNTEYMYDIKINPDATPYSVHSPRRISLPLHKNVKAELERLQSLGVIIPVTEPTPWCTPIVVVPKSSGDVRICVDLTKLNATVCRERYIALS